MGLGFGEQEGEGAPAPKRNGPPLWTMLGPGRLRPGLEIPSWAEADLGQVLRSISAQVQVGVVWVAVRVGGPGAVRVGAVWWGGPGCSGGPRWVGGTGGGPKGGAVQRRGSGDHHKNLEHNTHHHTRPYSVGPPRSGPGTLFDPERISPICPSQRTITRGIIDINQPVRLS